MAYASNPENISLFGVEKDNCCPNTINPINEEDIGIEADFSDQNVSGGISINVKDLEKAAIDECISAIKRASQLKDIKSQCNLYIKLGDIKTKMTFYDQAIICYQHAEILARDIDNVQIEYLACGKSLNLFYCTQNYSFALSQARRMITLSEMLNNKKGMNSSEEIVSKLEELVSMPNLPDFQFQYKSSSSLLSTSSSSLDSGYGTLPDKRNENKTQKLKSKSVTLRPIAPPPPPPMSKRNIELIKSITKLLHPPPEEEVYFMPKSSAPSFDSAKSESEQVNSSDLKKSSSPATIRRMSVWRQYVAFKNSDTFQIIEGDSDSAPAPKP